MDDLISRQAAIDKAIMIPVARIVTEDKVLWRKAVFVEDIQDLPSAQSEDRCSECDAWNQYIHYPRTQQWIPCSERLPEPGEYYLVTKQLLGRNYTEYREIDIAKYDFDGWDKANKVLAWCELPKPWEGGHNG